MGMTRCTQGVDGKYKILAGKPKKKRASEMQT